MSRPDAAVAMDSAPGKGAHYRACGDVSGRQEPCSWLDTPAGMHAITQIPMSSAIDVEIYFKAQDKQNAGHALGGNPGWEAGSSSEVLGANPIPGWLRAGGP